MSVLEKNFNGTAAMLYSWVAKNEVLCFSYLKATVYYKIKHISSIKM